MNGPLKPKTTNGNAHSQEQSQGVVPEESMLPVTNLASLFKTKSKVVIQEPLNHMIEEPMKTPNDPVFSKRTLNWPWKKRKDLN